VWQVGGAMAAHPGRLGLQLMGCALLGQLAGGTTGSNGSSLRRKRGVRSQLGKVLAALRHHRRSDQPGAAALQACGCAMIWVLASGGGSGGGGEGGGEGAGAGVINSPEEDSRVVPWGQPSGVEVACAASRAFPHEGEVQAATEGLLRVLLSGERDDGHWPPLTADRRPHPAHLSLPAAAAAAVGSLRARIMCGAPLPVGHLCGGGGVWRRR
jgi:hypothetical protein